MVMASTGLGLIGCIVGCTATSINALIGANLCNGLGAAGQLSFGIVLGELVPNKQRGPIVTLVFLSAAPFAVFGPAIARAFFINTAAKWRWSYYLGVIFSGIALLMYQFCYHPPTYTQLHVQGKSKWQQMKELDYGGLLIYFAGMVLSIIGLSWGGGTYPWVSGKVLGTLITGILCFVALPFYEAYVVKEGALVPPRLFRSIGYVAITVAATIGAMVYYALTILWPTILGTIYTTNVMKIGWQSSVVGGGILLGQVFGGFGLSYIPYVKWQTVIMSVLSMAFVTSLVSLSEDKHAEFIAFGTLACIFIGYVDNITFPGVTLVIEPQDIGLATGVLGSIRGFGGAVAQALYVSVLTNKLADYLPAYVAPAVVQAGLPASSLPSLFAGLTTGNFTAVPDITPTIIGVAATQAKRAYIDSFHIVFYATIPFSTLLILSACFVPNMDKYLGNNVAKRLQNFKNAEDSDVSEKQVETV
ncbi:fungal trichothecene efflux pump [Bisporella sp. PMI_857]|nr:fungal trichothecene efflux pump [Bisporella sp. PMI_857]